MLKNGKTVFLCSNRVNQLSFMLKNNVEVYLAFGYLVTNGYKKRHSEQVMRLKETVCQFV